jgi:hypothetical protein
MVLVGEGIGGYAVLLMLDTLVNRFRYLDALSVFELVAVRSVVWSVMCEGQPEAESA